jgi:hypothetical protein
MRRTSDECAVEIYGQKVYVRFLSLDEIERSCQGLLEFAGLRCNIAAMPVPVEDILEKTLHFHLEFDDLPGGVLGATHPESKTVVVDTSVDPSNSPHKLGQYRFTIAHEIGHIWLHLRYLAGLAEPDGDLGPPVEAGSDPLEVQANMFASSLLMPSSVVKLVLLEEEGAQRRSQRCLGYRTINSHLVAAMARRFEVSRTAMQIRLQRLEGLKVPGNVDFQKIRNCFPGARDATMEKEHWQRVIFDLANLKSLRRAIGDSHSDPDLRFLSKFL